MSRLVEVLNLATGEVSLFVTDPVTAVVSAHAISLGDFNTWDYAKYRSILTESKLTFLCGDCCAMKQTAKVSHGSVPSLGRVSNRSNC